MSTIIHELEKMVEAACASEKNIFGYGIWTHHIKQVVKVGRRMASEFEADAEIVEIAALLHDYAGIKDESQEAEHHLHGPRAAERILRELGYPESKIAAVKHCIAAHRASVPRERRTPEAECLANADAMVHIEQVPSLLHLAFVQLGMGIDEGTAWVRKKLKRTWNKLSPQIQERMRVKYEAALETLTAVEEEVN
ncbi:MAG: HD domain-containing protein [bacterium]